MQSYFKVFNFIGLTN